MAEDRELFLQKDLPITAFPILEEIRRQGKLCDVTLKVENQSVRAHRVVLAASIPYFNAMFTHDMAEAGQDEITIQGIDPSALEALVNYAYTGRLQLDTTNVQSLLVGASYLQLTAVKDACCGFLKNRLHPNNVLGVRSFSDQFACLTLVDSCTKYVRKHFVEVTKTEEFLSLEEKEVLELLACDELHVSTEEQVFEAALAWINHDLGLRGGLVAEVLRCVRMPLLTPQFLSDQVAAEELIKNSLACRDLLDEARDYHLMPERRPQLQTFRVRPRCCSDVIGLIYAVGGLTSCGDSVDTVECFDPYAGQWRVAEPMKTVRSRVGIAVLEGKLFAIGGYDGQDRLNTVEVFDPETRRWSQVAPMSCRRSALGAAVLHGKLYVCGGYDGCSSLSSVEVYCPKTNTWSIVSNMIKHRSAAGVTVFDGQIYALGGHDGLCIFDSVESFSALSGAWHQTSTMLSKRCRLGVTPLQGRLFACGGYDGSIFLRSVECFDAITRQWSLIQPMRMKRSRVALVANCGKLYAVGGYDGISNLNSVEAYDPDAQTWNFVAPMRAHQGGVGVGVIPLEPGL